MSKRCSVFFICIVMMILSISLFGGSRFGNNKDGTITDTKTGLMWQRDGKSAGVMNWHKAKKYCNNLRLGGHSDWRLPTRKELAGLIAEGNRPYHSWLKKQGFSKIDWNAYWAAPTLLSPQKTSWAMRMKTGYVYYYFKKDLWFYVLAVRPAK